MACLDFTGSVRVGRDRECSLLCSTAEGTSGCTKPGDAISRTDMFGTSVLVVSFPPTSYFSNVSEANTSFGMLSDISYKSLDVPHTTARLACGETPAAACQCSAASEGLLECGKRRHLEL